MADHRHKLVDCRDISKYLMQGMWSFTRLTVHLTARVDTAPGAGRLNRVRTKRFPRQLLKGGAGFRHAEGVVAVVIAGLKGLLDIGF
jgi:hypothetical protein